MISFDKLWEDLKNGILDYSKENLSEYKDEAFGDGKAFLEKSKDDLKRWAELLAGGKITQDDFGWLLQGKKDLAEMEALKQKGLAKEKLEDFSKGLIEKVKTIVVASVKN